MSDAPDNPVLTMLRAIRGGLCEVRADVAAIKERAALLEISFAGLSRRIDRLAGDMERVRRRLDLADA